MKWLWWSLAAALAAWIFWMSSRPIAISHLPENSDKVIHAATWALLGGLVAGGGRAAGWSARTALAIAIAVAALYGLADELHQSQVPSRDASVADWIADAVGAIAGALAITYLRRHAHRP